MIDLKQYFLTNYKLSIESYFQLKLVQSQLIISFKIRNSPIIQFFL